MRQLRDFQAEDAALVRADWAGGLLRPAIVHATGLGKGSLVGHFATTEVETGGSVLIIAHRMKLLRQLADTCRAFRPDIPIGFVAGDRDQRGFLITCAMTPTLARPARLARLKRPTLVIYDEAHHAPAKGARAALEALGCYENVRTLGLTATLVRGDKLKPSDVWQKVSAERDIAWGCTHGPDPDDPLRTIPCDLGDGWLAPPRGRCVVVDHLDLGKVKTSHGDYQSNDLGMLIEQDVDQIAKAWLEHGENQPTVAFTPSVASAVALANEFAALGVPVGTVFGTQSEGEQERVYQDLRHGRIRVLVSVMVPTEGFSEDSVGCVLVARPTKLPGLLTQMIGRGTRRYPGKRYCIVLDTVGATRGQSFVNLTDLSPMFERDTSELDALPCEACGGFKAAAVRADPDLEQCSCTREGPGLVREPNRPQGPVRYEDLDLIPDAKATYRWLRSRLGVPFLVGSLPWCKDRVGVIYPDTGRADSPTWTPGHVAVRGPASWTRLDDVPCTFEQAQARVQAWAGPSPRITGAVKEWELGKATALGVPDPGRLDRRALVDAIAVARVSAVVDR